MADTRKLVIEIVDTVVDSDSKSQKKNIEEEGGINLSKLLHPIKTMESKVLGKNVIVNQAYDGIKNALIQTVELNLNRYFTIKEDYLGENTYNNAKSAINKVASGWSAVAGGALVGGPIGAIVGGTTWLVGQISSNQSTMSSYYQGLNSSTMETSFARTRAGLTNNSRGTEN